MVWGPSVVDSKTITTSESQDRFSLLPADKSFILKTALATEYESRYLQVGERKGYGIARATRIQELRNYASPGQRTLLEDQGIGIIWRRVNISRFDERDGGVYFELEAIGLSRDVPASIRWLVEPVIRRVSQGSLCTTRFAELTNLVRFPIGMFCRIPVIQIEPMFVSWLTSLDGNRGSHSNGRITVSLGGALRAGASLTRPRPSLQSKRFNNVRHLVA